jgi:Yip1-like protein
MALVDRVKAILLMPKNAWATIDSEPATVGSLYTGYAIPLAAIPAVAGFIGLSVIGIGVLGSRLKVPMGTGLTWAVVQYIGALVGVFVLALIIDALAPSFGGQKNQIQALKLAVYSATASWLAGIFNLIPGLAILGILGLYSLYLLFLGLPVLMKAPAEKALGYTIVVVISAVVIFMVIGMIASRAVGFGGWGMRPDFLTP